MRKRIGRDLPDGTYVEITAEERDGSDGLTPGFVITMLGWDQSGSWSGRACARNGRDATFAGRIHDLILRVAPELAPLVRVHLAAPDGTPMHAKGNGWYFYSDGHVAYELAHYGRTYLERHGTGHERAARALHIDPADLPKGFDAVQFGAFVDSLAQVWRLQAAAARLALENMVDGHGVEDR